MNALDQNHGESDHHTLTNTLRPFGQALERLRESEMSKAAIKKLSREEQALFESCSRAFIQKIYSLASAQVEMLPEEKKDHAFILTGIFAAV
jgi:hypothetical protein